MTWNVNWASNRQKHLFPVSYVHNWKPFEFQLIKWKKPLSSLFPIRGFIFMIKCGMTVLLCRCVHVCTYIDTGEDPFLVVLSHALEKAKF